MKSFVKLLFTIFDMPLAWKPGFAKILIERKRKGGKLFLARVGGHPAGIGGLLFTMNTGLIYGLGTLQEYRRMGVGTALTLRAIEESIKEGNDLHTLQVEKGGYAERFYGRLGFKSDHIFSYFVKDNVERS